MTDNRKASEEFIDFDETRRKKSHCETIIEVNNKWMVEHPGESDPIKDSRENVQAAAEISEFEAILATEPPPPELPPRQPLFKVSGVLEEFSVQKVIGYFTEREYDPEAFAHKEASDQVGSLILAMVGNAAGSAVTGQSKIRQNDFCNFVRGKINGVPFYGWLGKTNVQVDDYVEMAVMGQGDCYVVYAIALPKLRTISMTPRCHRGREAEIRVLTTRGFPAFYSPFLIFFLIMHFKGVEWRDTAIGAAIGAGVLLPALLATIYKIRNKTSPVILLAEDIFAALGFADPKKVDLRKLTRRRLKQEVTDTSTSAGREMPSRRSTLRYFHYY
ncbi:putative type VI secretion system effector [Salmonella enterica]|uniref:Uncharacterized protein n=5 Tax=Salmonella enterica TaxID=28901 RepID=A0A3U0H2C2_SALDZ|nr:putative type VI secretion system effector [Salmonella enterica]EAA2775437.1 hypothetical protein [Salmonella enterica subsp. diarizonae]ECF6858508.1 hypothetical protein [Salmonella enterica subsp. arizonae]ECI2309503.1 hypothetical protein [Salmonella enterica subsp. enterica serovar Infantis]ECS6419226.1 hypothetical protein [Salmonella enterica subsp. diarizonae serovar 50:r:z]ECU8750558.1 hypothetical protein [Salmonella enterica subsp. diarizonae str. CFSAN000558]EDQ4426785.1 hypothe